MTANTKDSSTEVVDAHAAWLAERRRGIGGSDSAAVAGLSPWKTPLQVYLEKIGEEVSEENEAMRRGTLLEPAVRQMYCDATGRTVETPAGIIRHPEHDWMIASLDGIADREIVSEFKTSRTRDGWGQPGSAEIPVAYYAQVSHYMMVTGFLRAEIGVLFGDFEFGVYVVPADPEFQGMLAEVEASFWRSLELREPPEAILPADLKRRYPKSYATSVEANHEIAEACATLALAKTELKIAEAKIEDLETLIKAFIAENEALTLDGKVLATWKNVNRAPGFDAKQMRADHPELVAQYLSESAPSRTFLLKK